MSTIPNYYIGSVYGYEARKVVEDYNLSYNSGTAVSYLLRAGAKSSNSLSQIDKQIDDIKKAINHLNFEIDKLNNVKAK
tara:strand:+ start:3248 stop:3484 length:237 start_codon:yes stop_codon:yes gene_type:complete